MSKRPFESLLVVALAMVGALLLSPNARAQSLDNWVEQTGQSGPAEEPKPAAEELATSDTTSTSKRSWLVQESEKPPLLGGTQGATTSGTTGGLAIALVALIAGAAIWLKRKRAQVAGPVSEANARVAVLSTSRLGPKAYAVSVTAGGRVMLLGVTDQSVSHLAWLDEPSPEALLQAAAPAPTLSNFEVPEPDDLPDDYPGSALRNSTPPNAPLANSQDLARFQKLLQGAVEASPAGRAYEEPEVNAASQLAARTQDVLSSTAAALSGVTPILSMRRKRHRRRAATAPPPKVTTAPPPPTQAIEEAFEGQVAGLKALKTHS